MRKYLVYDLPMRLFHWFFAFLFIFAFFIAKTIDSESLTYSYHMLAGLLLGFVVLLRLIWGFTGTQHSRFASFALRPKDLVNYFKGVLSKDGRKWAGHNPASSWAGLTMMALGLSLAISGFLMARGYKEELEDIHELFANGFLIVVLGHVAGVVLHMFRHKDGLAFSMFHGRKSEINSNEAIAGSRPAVGLVFVILVIAFATLLSRNFNPEKKSLQLFGVSLQLGDVE